MVHEQIALGSLLACPILWIDVAETDEYGTGQNSGG